MSCPKCGMPLESHVKWIVPGKHGKWIDHCPSCGWSEEEEVREAEK